MKTEIKSNFEACSVALALAITAPTDAQYAQAYQYAEHFSRFLSPLMLTRAKARAIALVKQWDREMARECLD